ncbi:MAG: YtxH domain-containing protein [Gemmatimonadaceae bacterium]
MFNSPSPPRPELSATKAPPPGSIPQPASDDNRPYEMVPDWNNIGLFSVGIAVGAVLGAAVALLLAPASGDETRHRISRRVRHMRGDDNVWDELAAELERAADEREQDEEEVLAAAKP